MTVEELIKRLEMYNPQLQVVITKDSYAYNDYHVAEIICKYEPSPVHNSVVRIIPSPQGLGIG